MKPPISCILFDLDNTLTDRSESIRAFSERFLTDFRNSLHRSATLDKVHQVIQTGDGGGYRPKEQLFREIQQDLRWEQTPHLEAIQQYWYTVSPACMRLRTGVQATLVELKQRGFKLGIITNGKTAVQNATIDALALRPYMDIILVSEAVGLRKPDPRIFHLALSDLDSDSKQALYIGDNPQADVGGAQAAGLQAVWFSNNLVWPTELTQPDYQISEIGAIINLLTNDVFDG